MIRRGLLILVCALSARAYADDAHAEKLVAQGRAFLEARDPKAACAKFEAAIVVAPGDVPIMLDLGICNEQLDKLATALRWYRRAQAAAMENKLTELYQRGAEHALAIAPKVATVKLVVGGTDTAIEIDGYTVDNLEVGRVELDAGAHEIVAREPGKRAVHKSLQIRDGEAQSVAIAVTEAAVARYLDAGRGQRRAGLIVGGVGLVLMAGVFVYIGVKIGRYHDTDLPVSEQNEARDDVKYVGTTGFFLSVAAIGTGAILYLTAAKKVRVSDGTALVPVVGDRAGGLAVTGRF